MEKIILIRRRTNMGITQPFICETECSRWFVVKTLNMMPIEQLLSELVGSTLARYIGLPCPAIELLYFDEKLATLVNPSWVSSITRETAVGSLYYAQSTIAQTAEAKNVGYFSETQQKELYMFDRWICNSDRTASKLGTGNINLLFDKVEQRILVIDHNLAFDKNTENEFSNHLFAPSNREWRLDWVDKQNFTDNAINLLNNFDNLYEIFPDDWFNNDEYCHRIEKYIEKVKLILTRIKSPEYWKDIE